jgi:hypothetical protein
MFIAPVFSRTISGLIASGHALRNLCRSNFPSQQTSSPPWNLFGGADRKYHGSYVFAHFPGLAPGLAGFSSNL